MRPELEPTRLSETAAEFNAQTRRSDGPAVIASLDAGLSLLRRVLLLRLHQDVEQTFGVDSVLAPVSFAKAEAALIDQVELYQIAESAAAASSLALVGTGDWYARWLVRLRFQGPLSAAQAARLVTYGRHSLERRRLEFSDILAANLRESARAPLVLFRLLPWAVHVVTAVAFGHQQGAAALRRQQVGELPSIEDCHECHGRVLDNGRQCPRCGNPLWTLAWMTSADA